MRETADVRSRRPGSASALAAAHDDLLRRCHAAERSGDRQEGAILGALVDVADYVKRIGDNPDSAHYRAEKAGALLTAAIRLHRDALLAYGGWPEDDANEDAVLTAAKLLEDVAEHVRQTMWEAMHIARGEAQTASRSRGKDLVHAGEQLARWAAGVHGQRSAGGIGI
jgi:hypothetical protein